MGTPAADRGTPWQLATGIELLPTEHGVAMAYVPATRRYVRLSPVAAAFVAQLQRAHTDGIPSTEPGPASVLAMGSSPALAPAQASTIVDALARVGILCPPDHVTGSTPGRWPVLRVPLWRPNRVLMPPAGIALCERLATRLGPLATSMTTIAIAAIGAAWWRGETLGHSPTSWGALAALVALHVVLHEAAHGLTAGRYGVPIREFGVGLLYWCLPVAYTDRTDAYRLRNGHALAAIAAAGPIFDVAAMGVTATCVLAGWADATGRAMLTAQLAIALANLNPLLPGDAYHVAASLLGRLHARRDAFILLVHLVRHGRPPERLAQLTNRQRCGYAIYAAASALYIVVVVSLPAVMLYVSRWRQ